MARIWLKLACAFACLAAPATLSLAQPQVPQATETAPSEAFDPGQGGLALHKASGFAFPDRLADMPRRKFRVYAPDDVQVDYTLRGGGNGDAWLDVFVYPAPRSVGDEAQGVEEQIVRNMTATPLAIQPPLPATAAGALGKWYEGRFQGRELTSGYVLVKRGRWYVLARGSSPKEAGVEGMSRLLAAIAAIDWRWNGEAPRLTRRDPAATPLMPLRAKPIWVESRLHRGAHRSEA